MSKAFSTLAAFFGRDKLDFKLVAPAAFAHCVIDVQRQYCDPSFSKFGTRQTDTVAGTISRITPKFRAAGMPTYMIYMADWQKNAAEARGGFHRVAPAETDVLFGKHMYSAFEGTDLEDRLKTAGARTLLISGFDIDCCVNATVQDALRAQFNVWVMTDCIGNGGPPVSKAEFLKLMRDNGAELMTSGAALSRLRNAVPAPA